VKSAVSDGCADLTPSGSKGRKAFRSAVVKQFGVWCKANRPNSPGKDMNKKDMNKKDMNKKDMDKKTKKDMDKKTKKDMDKKAKKDMDKKVRDGCGCGPFDVDMSLVLYANGSLFGSLRLLHCTHRTGKERHEHEKEENPDPLIYWRQIDRRTESLLYMCGDYDSHDLI
jgi:hypothetical protein